MLNWAQEQYQFNHNVSSLIDVVVFDHHYLLSASSHLKFFHLITNNFQQNVKNFENENEILNMLLQFLGKKTTKTEQDKAAPVCIDTYLTSADPALE